MLCKAASPHPVHLPPGTWLPFTKVLRDVTEHPCTIPAPGAGHTWVRGATSSVLEVVALPAPCRPQDREVLGSGHPQNGVCPRSWGSTAQQCRRGSSVGSGASLLSVQVRAREPRNFLTKQTTSSQMASVHTPGTSCPHSCPAGGWASSFHQAAIPEGWHGAGRVAAWAVGSQLGGQPRLHSRVSGLLFGVSRHWAKPRCCPGAMSS